jgi:predicted nucleic acid-binding protein
MAYYLLDANVISEYRRGSNANWGVREFFRNADPDSLFLPVQVLGEIRAGIAKLHRNGVAGELEKAKIYEKWIDDELLATYSDRIIEFDTDSAQLWGMLLTDKKDPHTIDKQIAAMAITRDMTVVTRDKGDAFSKIPKVEVLNPFRDPPLS